MKNENETQRYSLLRNALSPDQFVLLMNLVENTPEPEQFPIEIFPEVIQKYIAQVAMTMNCPVDFIAIAVLGTTSTAIGNSRSIRYNSIWREYSSLILCIISKPGDKKSPALNIGLKPLRILQSELDYEAKQRNTLLSGEVADRGEPRKQIIITDTTWEALVCTLMANPRGVLIHHDEFKSLFTSMNQYKGGNGSDVQNYLSLYSSTRIEINRKGNPKQVVVPHPIATIIGGIQMDVLKEIKGVKSNGFIDRILFSKPDPLPRRLSDFEVPIETIDAYTDFIRKIFALQATIDCNEEEVPREVSLSPEALRRFKLYSDESTVEMNQDDFPPLHEVWSKMDGQCLRLCLQLHVMEMIAMNTDSTLVSEETMEKAVKLIAYFKKQVIKVSAESLVTDMDKQIQLALVALRKAKNFSLSARMVYTGKIAGCKNRKDAENLFKELEDRGYVFLNSLKKSSGGLPTLYVELMSQFQRTA
jgi:hypothetical protein